MKTRRIRALIAGALLAAVAVAARPALAGFATAPKVGDKARDFTLTGVDGQRLTLSRELASGPVVIVLLRGWPGYQCPFCTRQFGDFLAHETSFDTSGARVVWIYPGPSDQVQQRAREFLAGRALPASFRVATDPDYAFTSAYGLRWEAPGETSYPSTFVVDKAGIVRFAQISSAHDGRALAVDVLKALAALPK